MDAVCYASHEFRWTISFTSDFSRGNLVGLFMIGVWRSGSAPVLGTGGRRFDPGHPDQYSNYWSILHFLLGGVLQTVCVELLDSALKRKLR